MSAYAEPQRAKPYGPVFDPSTQHPPDPPPTGGDMTTDDIRRYMADLTNDLLFGAIERYHNEVLPRDRPKEPVIKAADDSDFSTRDVTTGGAMGFFVRSYVSEFIIARDKGRDQAHASGDGYDAAIAAYRQAVNPQ